MSKWVIMKWIGLTGGIAAGKSTVARLIESRGFVVIDADQISHQLTQISHEGYERIVSHFGPEILDENLKIDRKKLGHIVFSSDEKRKILEGILHPLIQSRVQKLRREYQNRGTQILFYDVPLLFENHMETQFDATVVVWCDAKTQLKRLMQRNRLTEVEALQRIQAQMPLSQKIKTATYCIDNSSSEYELILSVDVFLENLSASV